MICKRCTSVDFDYRRQDLEQHLHTFVYIERLGTANLQHTPGCALINNWCNVYRLCEHVQSVSVDDANRFS